MKTKTQKRIDELNDLKNTLDARESNDQPIVTFTDEDDRLQYLIYEAEREFGYTTATVSAGMSYGKKCRTIRTQIEVAISHWQMRLMDLKEILSDMYNMTPAMAGMIPMYLATIFGVFRTLEDEIVGLGIKEGWGEPQTAEASLLLAHDTARTAVLMTIEELPAETLEALIGR